MLRTPTLIVCVVAAIAGPVLATEVVLAPSKDNTIYSDPLFSNGSGQHLFSGRTAAVLNPSSRRGLIQFDVAGGVFEDATITNVTLTMYMSRTNVGSPTVNIALHRLSTEWGEGATDAQDEEGVGGPPEPGDATWEHTFFDTDSWTTQGGDFLGTVSAMTAVGDEGFYSWSSPQLIADVQDMLDNPGGNLGWILIGDEDQPTTAKRFDSRENPTMSQRPVLVIEFEGGVPTTSEWGLIAMGGLLLTGGLVVISRRRGVSCAL